MITYRAILDVPRELVHHLAGLLAEHRRQVGTRRHTRALPCWRQALLVLVWFRTGHDLSLIAAGFARLPGHRLPLPRRSRAGPRRLLPGPA